MIIKKPYLAIVIFLTAIIVSLSAAGYSVFGLSKLFSGAKTSVIIMTGSLEFAKLILAATVHIYWNQLKGLLKWYSVIAVIVLMMITSGGIYGFLSDAYQQTASKDEIVTKRVGLIKSKIENFKVRLDENKKELENVNGSSVELNKALNTNSQVQTIKNGQLLTSIQVTNKKPIENQLNQLNDRKVILNTSISNFQDSIQKYEISVIETESSNQHASELGPLKYLSGLTGYPMDKVVNWFLIMIMLVFDPLAISLIFLGIFAYNQFKLANAVVDTPEPLESIVDEIIVPVVEPEPIPVEPEPKPKRKYNRKPKVEPDEEVIDEIESIPVERHFDIKIEGLEELPIEPKPIAKKRRRVDKTLNTNTEKQIEDNLNKSKPKLDPSQIRTMSHEQVEEWKRNNRT